MLKQVHADYRGDERYLIKVKYVITKRQCVFSAVTKIPSSINAAECIIQKICEIERRKPETLRFFDVQTHLGYTSKKPGVFEVDELLFSVSSGEVTVNDWKPTSFLPNKQHVFSHLIGTAL